MKIAMLGTGAYSLALTYALSKNNNDITMWTHDINHVNEFNTTNKVASVLDFELKETVKITTSLKDAMKDSDLIIIGTASRFFTSLVTDMKEYYKKNTPICIATKGIDDTSKEFLSNIASKALKTKTISVLSGPTFAIDIVTDEPVALALASKSKITTEIVKKTLSSDRLKLRDNTDLIGVQVCGSVKNIIAIAAGIINGLGYSNSTTAFLINEAMHDIKNSLKYLGANKNTILSFAGIGDLILTCTSTKSRNFSFGFTIGKYNDPKKTKEYLDNTTVEGYFAITTFRKLLRKHQIKVPIINLIDNIVNSGKDPNELVKFLIKK